MRGRHHEELALLEVMRKNYFIIKDGPDIELLFHFSVRKSAKFKGAEGVLLWFGEYWN